jgi:hypothetical protein
MPITSNSILTIYNSLFEAAQYYDFPINTTTNNYLYAFFGKVDSWANESSPDYPQQHPYYIKKTFKNMFYVKQLTSKNISPVVPRSDWTSGTVYTPYDDNIDMFTLNSNGVLTPNFYVRNTYDQIFKCIWNNNGAASTVEPVLYPGTITIQSVQTTSDGYKWVYITTIDKGLKLNFFDNNWMPISLTTTPQNSYYSAGLGTVDAVNVTYGGSGYTQGNTTVNVTITGDGYNANGYAYVNSSGIIQDVMMTNSGSNYTYANVAFSPATGYSGSGANGYTVISPIGGNGIDPLAELGCNHVMVSYELDGSENGQVNTTLNYRQTGLIVNPTLTNGNTATGSGYNMTTLLYVNYSPSSLLNGEIVYQGQSLSQATFYGTVTNYDASNGIVSVINTAGTPNPNGLIIGNTSGGNKILLQYATPNFQIGSGYLVYLQNCTPIQRSDNANEQFRLVLKF